MSRRNAHSRRTPEIDWERAELLHTGRTREEPRIIKPREEPKPHNEFTRQIRGFSGDALAFMLQHGFEAMDEEGVITVKFIGISEKPGKRIDYKNPALLRSLDGQVVLSGVVDKKSVSEIGNGSGRIDIEQAEPPEIDSHDSARRLNVALGRKPSGFDPIAGTDVIKGSLLELSPVNSINGHTVTSEHMAWEIDHFWNRNSAYPAV